MTIKRCLLPFLVAAMLAVAQPNNPDAALGAARHLEEAEGNYPAAIEAYKKIVARAGKDRALAAKALVRMGQCHEKLGNSEARKTYERAVREFGDQKEAVAIAQARLASMGDSSAAKEVRNRLLWDGASLWLWGASADGRWISFQDPDTQAVVIRDLVSGEQRYVKNKDTGTSGTGISGSVFSRDGSRIAFQWKVSGGPDQGVSLRTIRVDGTGERVLLRLEENQWILPFCWSPDGKWIAVRKGSSAGWRILLISAEDGQERVLVTHEALRGNIPAVLQFSPDGRWLGFNASLQEGSTRRRGVYVVPVSESASTPTEIAVDAMLTGWAPDGGRLVFSRERGNKRELYLVPVSDGKAAGEPQKIAAVSDFRGYPLAVTSSGSLIYQTQNRTWDSVVSEVDLTSNSMGKTAITRPSMGGAGWAGMGGGVRFSPDGRRVLILLADGDVLIRSLDDGSEYKIVPQLKGRNRVEWAADGASLLMSGGGLDGKSGLYRVNARSGAAALVAEEQAGRSSMCFAEFVSSPDGKRAYCYMGASGIHAIDLENGNISQSVWPHPGFEFGDMRFSHDGRKLALFGTGTVAVVDVGTGKLQEVTRIPGNYLGGDWSPDNRFLLTTWCAGGYESDLPTELVKLPVEGGPPMRTPLGAHYIGLRLSPDGKRLAMTRWSEQHNQIWALENFLPAAKTAK